MNSKNKEGGFFPAIALKSTKGGINDSENREYKAKKGVRNSPTPNGTGNTTVKLPFLERSKFNNVADTYNGKSISQSKITRSRNKHKKSETLHRSPSLPSQFEVGRNYNRSDTDTRINQTRRSPSFSRDGGNKLPNIFSSQSPVNRVSQSPDPFSHKEFPTWNGPRERTYVIRRTESLQNNYVTSPEPLLDNYNQRSQTQAALLLPLPNSDSRMSYRGNKKKKRVHPRNGTQVNLLERHNSNAHDRSSVKGWEAEVPNGKVNRREDSDSGKRSIEITRSGEVKRWMKEVDRHEGQIQA